MAKLSRGLFLKRFLPQSNALDDRSMEEYRRGSQMKPTVSGSAIDLAGKGEAIVGTAHFFSTPSRDNTLESEFGAVVLLALQKSTSGQWTPFYQWAAGGPGDSVLRKLQILGFIDINGDGILDLVTEEHGYEHFAFRFHVSQLSNGKLQYRDRGLGRSGGC